MSDGLDAYSKWLSLLRVKGLAGQRLRHLISSFGNPEAVLQASLQSLRDVKGIGEEIAQGVRQAASGQFDREVRRDLEWLKKHRGTLCTYLDPDYPERLKEIHSPPALLYVRGTLRPQEPAVAMVGSRSASDYGKRLAGRIAEELSNAGLTIVSGLAYGVDASCHMGTLRARGRTVAVLGSGLKKIYPKSHTELAEQVSRSGAVISELPLDTSPQRKNFVPRNRIISGMCVATIVVEAGEQSGALATARFAQEQNREVFAFPGRASDDTSLGANRLIKEHGAQLITGAEDVLQAIKSQLRPRALKETNSSPEPPKGEAVGFSPNLDGDEAVLYDTLSNDASHIDDLARSLGWDVGRVSSLLGLLEMRGLVERQAGARFRRAEGMT